MGKKIFSKLNELLVGAENAKEVDIHINANKTKIATNKSTAGKVLEYKRKHGQFREIWMESRRT